MPTHYVYAEPKKTELNQVGHPPALRVLDGLLTEYFPYYHQHRDYRYFMVLTQTCDLVRRDGVSCAAPYISIAAVRPVKDVLMLEAEKLQDESLRGTNLVGNNARQALAMFLQSLMDNNKPGYFYLHTDHTRDRPALRAFLQLAALFRAQHYDRCLEAKIAQLQVVQAAWPADQHVQSRGHDRMGQQPAERSGAVASKIPRGTVITVSDEQIREALADLRDNGTLATMAPEDVKGYVQRKRLVPKLKQFKDRAPK